MVHIVKEQPSPSSVVVLLFVGKQTWGMETCQTLQDCAASAICSQYLGKWSLQDTQKKWPRSDLYSDLWTCEQYQRCGDAWGAKSVSNVNNMLLWWRFLKSSGKSRDAIIMEECLYLERRFEVFHDDAGTWHMMTRRTGTWRDDLAHDAWWPDKLTHDNLMCFCMEVLIVLFFLCF
jgi:hypothetical protein